MGISVISSSVVSVIAFSSGGGFLTLLCFTLGSLPWETSSTNSWNTFSLSFTGVCRAVSLTSSHSSLLADVVLYFVPLCKYVIPEVLPLPLMCSALVSGGSVLKLAGTGSAGHGRSFWWFSKKLLQ